MGSVKRLYLYTVAAISLLVLAVGIENLVAVILAEIAGSLGGSVIAGESSGREQVSLAIALVVVGAPVFAIHWWLIVRGWRGTDQAAADDRRSAIRGFHMALVATVSLGFALYAAQRLVGAALAAILGVAPAETPDTGDIALLVVAVPVWWLHMARRNADLRHDRLDGVAAWVTRLNRYVWMFIGLMTLLIGASQLIQTVSMRLIGEPDIGSVGDWSVRLVASSFAMIVTGLVVWWLLASDARNAIRDAAVIGEDDRASALRAAYFGAVLLVALASAGLTVASAFTSLGRILLGVADETGVRAFMESVVGPLLVAVPFVLAGWLHWRAMRSEAAEAGEPAIAGAERLLLHLTALVGIVFLSVGAARLAASLLEMALGRSGADDLFLGELAWCSAQIVVGAVLWLPAWSALVRRRAIAPIRERLATTARAYLLLVVGGALVGVVPSAVFALSRLIDDVLGSETTNFASDLPIPLAIIMVGSVVAAYHGRLVISDLRLAAARLPAAAAPSVTDQRIGTASPAMGPASLALVLRGEVGDDLEAVVAALRDHLPPGVQLEGA